MENDEQQDIALDSNEEAVEETTAESTEKTVDWQAEALKQKAINERLSKKLNKPIIREDSEFNSVKQTVAQLELAEKKRQFGYEHQLSPDETDAVFKLNPNPTKDDLENEFVKGGISALRAKKRVENATPHPSTSSPKFEGKEFLELSEDERRKNYDKYIEAKAKRK